MNASFLKGLHVLRTATYSDDGPRISARSKERIHQESADTTVAIKIGVDKNEQVVCAPTAEPQRSISPGQYYIVDRKSGGVKKRLRQFFDVRDPKDGWFALYAADGRIDDKTFCDGVERGNFRLHPKGSMGISQGCIVIDNELLFDQLAMKLRGSDQMLVPGLDVKGYGIVTVS
jgi:hypothetical protein